MILASLKEERNLWQQGFKNIIGLDEVGRGAWAGPLVAGAVMIDKKRLKRKRASFIKFVRDSKLLTPKIRQEVFEDLIKTKWLNWSIGIVEVEEIDTFGLAEANRLVIKRALGGLTLKPDFLLIDSIKLPEYKKDSKSISHGDRKVFSIACASIIAKVIRDEMMRKLAQRYPYWGFDKHKGYGTQFHQEMIERYGISEIHRRSFRPIKGLVI